MNIKAVTDFTKKHGGGILSTAGNMSEVLQEHGARSWDKSLIEYEGEMSKRMAAIDEKRLRNEVNKTVGTAVANAGASGFSIDSESTQQAIDDIVRSGELDAALIRINGDIGKWRADVEVDRMKSEGQNRAVASIFNSVSSFIR